MATYTKDERRRYISILGDGKFHETVPMATEGAILREYETSDGKKGSKWELVYRAVVGHIVNVNFMDTDYGEVLHLTMDDGGIITTNTSSRYGSDIMKKLPNVKFGQEIEILPWAFEEDGKKRSGVSLKQNEEKIESYFDSVAGDGKRIQVHGFPVPGSDLTSNQWKLYFAQATEFLTNYIKENICPKINNATPSKETELPKRTEINPDDIPF